MLRTGNHRAAWVHRESHLAARFFQPEKALWAERTPSLRRFPREGRKETSHVPKS